MPKIDRCYCFDETFAALKEVADETGASTIGALQEHVQFGENCQLCHPYVRRMLSTGETTFCTLLSEDDTSSDERNVSRSGH